MLHWKNDQGGLNQTLMWLCCPTVTWEGFKNHGEASGSPITWDWATWETRTQLEPFQSPVPGPAPAAAASPDWRPRKVFTVP